MMQNAAGGGKRSSIDAIPKAGKNRLGMKVKESLGVAKVSGGGRGLEVKVGEARARLLTLLVERSGSAQRALDSRHEQAVVVGEEGSTCAQQCHGVPPSGERWQRQTNIVPAALEMQITAENVDQGKAGVVIEAANFSRSLLRGRRCSLAIINEWACSQAWQTCTVSTTAG